MLLLFFLHWQRHCHGMGSKSLALRHAYVIFWVGNRVRDVSLFQSIRFI